MLGNITNTYGVEPLLLLLYCWTNPCTGQQGRTAVAVLVLLLLYVIFHMIPLEMLSVLQRRKQSDFIGFCVCCCRHSWYRVCAVGLLLHRRGTTATGAKQCVCVCVQNISRILIVLRTKHHHGGERRCTGIYPV